MSVEASTRLRLKWLEIVSKRGGGPRPRTVLLGVARTPEEQRVAEPLLELMLAEGSMAMHGERRAASYGLPGHGRGCGCKRGGRR